MSIIMIRPTIGPSEGSWRFIQGQVLHNSPSLAFYKNLSYSDVLFKASTQLKEIGLFRHEELQMLIPQILGGFPEVKRDALKRATWVIRKDAERIVDSVERKMYIEEQTDYVEQRLEFLHRKYEAWKADCHTLSQIIERIRQYVSSETESIRLSTIHRAKGLENDRVFILAYDELPFQHLEQKDWERVQETNLMYVAVTRAKKELYLVKSPIVETLQERSLFEVLPFGDE
jgi:superfamily I DNA/RNA helicase